MSVTTTDQFARRLGTLWRDTGMHVLALAEGDEAEVVVLAGGGAVLWRLLEQPLDLPTVMSRLQTSTGDAPDADEVHTCLHDLMARGLIHAEDRSGQ